MSYRVSITPSAERDFRSQYDYIFARSPLGAARWANAFFEMLASLADFPHRGLALESSEQAEEIREIFFKTRAGRKYRALFVIRGNDVFVIHIRGPGQDIMKPEDLVLPR